MCLLFQRKNHGLIKYSHEEPPFLHSENSLNEITEPKIIWHTHRCFSGEKRSEAGIKRDAENLSDSLFQQFELYFAYILSSHHLCRFCAISQFLLVSPSTIFALKIRLKGSNIYRSELPVFLIQMIDQTF